MDLSHVILGSIVTEKAERLKIGRNYTLKVSSGATKVDVINALKEYYDVEVSSVRAMRVGGKTRSAGPYRTITKRHPFKKMIVTLHKESKTLDLTKFKA